MVIMHVWCVGLEGHSGEIAGKMVGYSLAAAVLSCEVQSDRWIASHLAVGALFECCRWTCRVTQPVKPHSPFGLLLGCLLLI